MQGNPLLFCAITSIEPIQSCVPIVPGQLLNVRTIGIMAWIQKRLHEVVKTEASFKLPLPRPWHAVFMLDSRVISFPSPF
jgi:hypothetical protein